MIIEKPKSSYSPHRLIRAFLKQPVDKTPVWLMRQAGRYLPEYRALREKIPDFLTLCKTPDLACEISLQPVSRFDLDGAIIFSDILTIPNAMGLELQFVQNEGPQFSQPIRTLNDIKKLFLPDPEIELRYVLDTLRFVKSSLRNKLPVIGFSGSPWTLAVYMIEGKGSDNFMWAKKMLYQFPEMLQLLLEKLANAVTLYLNAQIAAGADAVMIFDTWGGLLTSEDYENFSLHYIQKIISKLHPLTPVILFTKFGGQWLEKMVSTGAHVLGLDWTTSLSQARERVGRHVALQGNLDPLMLLTTPEKIEKAVYQILSDYGPYAGHVFNLGHGILQQTPVDNVAALVNAVHQFNHKKNHIRQSNDESND